MMTDVPTTLATGIPGLDAVLGGGFNRHALALIVGAPVLASVVLAGTDTPGKYDSQRRRAQ